MINSNVTKYMLNEMMLSNIIEDIVLTVKSSENLIKETLEIDNKYSKKIININKIIEIVESYKESLKPQNENPDRKMILYNGDPYLTLHICMQSVVRKVNVLLITDEYFLGINELLIKIIKNSCYKYNFYNLIELDHNLSIRQLKEVEKVYNELIIIGDQTNYEFLRDSIRVKYYPYFNIGLYCDTDELKELEEAVCTYANQNNFGLEVYYDDIDNVIFDINNDETKDEVVILTNNRETKDKFKQEIINKRIYINDNPFKDEVGVIYDYLV